MLADRTGMERVVGVSRIAGCAPGSRESPRPEIETALASDRTSNILDVESIVTSVIDSSIHSLRGSSEGVAVMRRAMVERQGTEQYTTNRPERKNPPERQRRAVHTALIPTGQDALVTLWYNPIESQIF
jgi:hypothetical protein